MAFVVVPPSVLGGPPAALLDPQDATWRDPNLFDTWCDRHEIDSTVSTCAPTTWFDRFRAGRDRWARSNGFADEVRNFIDHSGLKESGVPFVGSLSRAAARAEIEADDIAAFRRSCRLQSYGGPVDERYLG